MKNRGLLRLALALMVLAALVSVGLGQVLAAGFGSLQGKVKDAETGEPIADAIVKVEIGNGIQVATGQDGYYLFSNIIPQGKHKVVVKKPGYEQKTLGKIRIGPWTKTLNVELCKKGSEAAKCKPQDRDKNADKEQAKEKNKDNKKDKKKDKEKKADKNKLKFWKKKENKTPGTE